MLVSAFELAAALQLPKRTSNGRTYRSAFVTAELSKQNGRMIVTAKPFTPA